MKKVPDQTNCGRSCTSKIIIRRRRHVNEFGRKLEDRWLRIPKSKLDDEFFQKPLTGTPLHLDVFVDVSI